MNLEMMNTGFEGPEWDQFCQDAIKEIHEEEREALLRVARFSSLADAVLLAGSLGHADLFTSRLNARTTKHEDDPE